jgi:hypothetical protein
VASFDKVIPPGQEGKIQFDIDGKKVQGSFNKNATVQTNDPKHPAMTIALAGKIIPYIEVQPSTQVYLTGVYGERISKELIISSNEKKKNFKIVGLSSNIDDKITYSFAPDSEPGRYKITLWKNPKLPTLNTWGSFMIDTNSEHTPRKVIQISVATRGLIVCQPTQVNFGARQFNAAGGLVKTAVQGVEVFKIDGVFQIRNVEFSSPDYKAEIEPVEPGKRYRVLVTFVPATKKRNYRDEMIINTDDPQEPTVRVNILAHGL